MESLKKYHISEQDVQESFKNILTEFKELDKKYVHCPVPYSRISPHVGWISGAKTLGNCHRSNGYFQISVNRKYLSGYLSPESLRSTLIHEIIHTFPDCFDHRSEFQYWANRLSHHMHCDLGTYASANERTQNQFANLGKVRAATVCVDCGKLFTYPIMSKSVKRWERYGKPTRYCSICANKSHQNTNMLTIKYYGKSLIDGKMCDKSIASKAKAWIEKHVPPKEFWQGKSFEWTPEAVVNEYWWLKDSQDESPRIAAKAIPSDDSAATVPKVKATPRAAKTFQYEQLSLF